MKKVIFIALLGFTIGSCIVLSSSYFDKASATVMGKDGALASAALYTAYMPVEDALLARTIEGEAMPTHGTLKGVEVNALVERQELPDNWIFDYTIGEAQSLQSLSVRTAGEDIGQFCAPLRYYVDRERKKHNEAFRVTECDENGYTLAL
tara:strand:- start:11945 stop:12394 length:450 start_codon:yes stop_codon:yes gene_type:complete